MRKIKSIIFVLILSTNTIWANETCSRVAQINFQNILVDTNSSKKGEGLRYHLEKDEIALNYLNIYQEKNQLSWESAAMGTVGTLLLLFGALSNGSETSKQNLTISGGTLILVNYFMAKTLERNNEKNLVKAIDEYNKRNLPRIYFSPDTKNSKNNNSGSQVYLEKKWSF